MSSCLSQLDFKWHDDGSARSTIVCQHPCSGQAERRLTLHTTICAGKHCNMLHPAPAHPHLHGQLMTLQESSSALVQLCSCLCKGQAASYAAVFFISADAQLGEEHPRHQLSS
jgi:hypothetical protein